MANPIYVDIHRILGPTICGGLYTVHKWFNMSNPQTKQTSRGGENWFPFGPLIPSARWNLSRGCRSFRGLQGNLDSVTGYSKYLSFNLKTYAYQLNSTSRKASFQNVTLSSYDNKLDYSSTKFDFQTYWGLIAVLNSCNS